MITLLTMFERLSRPRALVSLIAVYVFVFGAIIFTLSQLQALSGHGILDFDRGYSVARVTEVLGSYGEVGMALYRRIQVLDLFNPALYSLILAVLTYLVWRGHGRPQLSLIALLGGVFDYLENITLFLISISFPDTSIFLVGISSTLSLIKNGVLVVSVLPLLFGMLLWVKNRCSRAR